MKMSGVMTVAAILLVMITPLFAQAQSSQEINRQILEKLTQIETRLTQVETRLGQLETRVARQEEGQKALSTRIDDLRGLIYVILAGMFALVGFIIWDRITTIDPVLKQTTELEKKLKKERDTIRKVFNEYAKKDPRFAEVLRTAGML
ncbi:MAG: hypothetical protein QME81_00805 [bacterium]|nr:hypothetical protein [bacterium]